MSKEPSTAGNGWLTRYKVNRPLNEYEISAKLDPVISVDLPPNDKGMLSLNSIFVEYIDRHFFMRGWAALGGVPIAVVVLGIIISLCLTVDKPLNNGEMPGPDLVAAIWVGVAIFCAVLVLVSYLLSKDFFRYTHYPIRFNRQNRKVYVFRHNGPDGVLCLDWDQVYWFVGRSRDTYCLMYDLRCHILDENGMICETFAVGDYSDFQAEVLQHWEMIRRYMEEPLEKLPFPPLALVVSTEPTLRNALVIHVLGQEGHRPIFLLLTLPWSFFRWISQKTCRRPRWPDEVEVICQIRPNDPFHLPEPQECGTFEYFNKQKGQALLYYQEQAEIAARIYQTEKYGPIG